MASPYPIPIGVIEPGDGDPATRVMGRITAGTQYARSAGFTNVSVYLNPKDFELYQIATGGLVSGAHCEQMVCDGARILPLDSSGIGRFEAVTIDGQYTVYPVMTDGQYLGSISLKAGMFVVREGDFEPRELLKDPITVGILRIGKHRYDNKGHPLKQKVPAILYAWDKAAMEEKDDRGEMTDMEKAFFAAVIQQQRQAGWLESLTAARQ